VRLNRRWCGRGKSLLQCQELSDVQPMITSELSIIIQRPRSEVFAYLMDLSNYVTWQAGLVKVAASDGMEVGSTITFTTVGLGQTFNLKARVVENELNSYFRVISSRGPITFDFLYELISDGEDTVVRLVNKIQTNSVFKLAEPVLQSISDSQYSADLKSLKAVLESSAEVKRG